MALTLDGLHLAPLGSGSKGNATWVGTEHHGVLVDCGLSTKQILKRMDDLGLGDAPIDAVLVTHEHSDHVAAAAILDRRLIKERGRTVPFYMTQGTLDGVPERRRPADIRTIRPGARFDVNGLTIDAHAVPHDTLSPVCYAVQSGDRSAAIVTDLGHVTAEVTAVLASVDLALVEFNHDQEMLQDGPYPWHLKQRIRGRHGHLSNRQGARLLRMAAAGRLKQVVLAHLSEENNTPDLALAAALTAVRDAGARIDVHVAAQANPVGPFRGSPTATVRPEPPSQPTLFPGAR